MPKDLRGFLEPPRETLKNKETQSSVPLANRRGLIRQGEPRVFQVRSGFVCNLCGQVHKNLERAFDCLGRCTVQLRLRSPVGPKLCGSQTHFSCTACGRGYANCDDAEQCFERCLQRLKPTPEFEAALRKVQVRYAQRLASHGLRHLERIDPLKEHTRMLETLTKEQAALVDSAHSQEKKGKTATAIVTNKESHIKSHDCADGALLEAVDADTYPVEASAALGKESSELFDAELRLSAEEPELSAEEPELSAEEPELSAEEPELSAEESLVQARLNESVSDLLGAATPLLGASDETNEVNLPKSELPSAGSPLDKESRADALASLELDEFAVSEGTFPEQISQNLLNTSDFAAPDSKSESEADLGEDVFSMLQDSSTKIEEVPRKKRIAPLRDNIGAIEGDLLDELV